MTEQKIRVAIAGAGIGREHLAGYLDLPEHYQVAAVCDIDRQRAEEAALPFGIPIETDLQAVLDNNVIDLIDICLPPHLHFEAILSALSSGKQVICEKPLVTSLREVDLVIDAAAQAGKMVFPVFQYRYGKAMTQLRSLIDAGLTGRAYVASLETHWNRGADYYAIPWRGTWSGEQGGAVLGHAIHSHDLLTTVFGPVAKVFAATATRINQIETEDCASIMLQMENGAVATSSITLGAATDTSRLRFCFEGLTAQSGELPYAPMADQWTFTARDLKYQADIDQVLSRISEVRSGFTGFLESVAHCIAQQYSVCDASSVYAGPPGSVRNAGPVTLQQARHSIELVSAIYQSAESDRSINLPLDQSDRYYDGWLPLRQRVK